jgi:nucleoid-associated protein YgaU
MKNQKSTLALITLLALGAGIGCASKPASSDEPTPAAAPAQGGTGGAAAPTAGTTAAAPAPNAAATAAAAENQRKLAEARQLLDQARGYSGLNGDQSSRMREAEAAMASGDGRRAYDILNGLLSELRAAKMTYAVVKGDSLWRIAGKSEVYGNPFQWPLIYKANADKIKDADLIHAGQEFVVDKAPTQAAIDAATKHAKTRGAWSVGAVEESDKGYLNSGN